MSKWRLIQVGGGVASAPAPPVPVVESVATTTQNATGTTFVVNLPSGIVPGDVLYVLGAQDTSVITITTPSGWTFEDDILLSDTKTQTKLWMYSRRADGTEGSTVSFVTNGNRNFVGVALRVSGVATSISDLTTVTNELADTADSTSHTGPSVTTPSENFLVLHAFATTHIDANGAAGMVAQGGETEVADIRNTNFIQPLIAVYTEDAVVAGTHNCAVTFSPNASQCVMISWAIPRVLAPVDAATIYLTLTPSGTEGKELTDAVTVPLLFTPSGVEARTVTDAATIPLLFTPSGADDHTISDAATVPLLFTPSGVDVKSGGAVDADTVPLLLTPSSVDIRERFEAATISLLLTPSGVEGKELIDAATVPLLFTPSGVDEKQQFDAATVPLLFTPSGVELMEGVESGTVYLLFTVSGVDEEEVVLQAYVIQPPMII